MWKRISALIVAHGFVPFIHNLIKMYLSLNGKTIQDEKAIIQALEDNRKVIIAILHQRMFGAIGYAQRFHRFSLAAMISQSRDGDMIAQIVERLNFHPIRGSSSKNGKEALEAVVAYLADHQAIVHAVDGPRGPRGVVKAGIIKIAQRSGADIFPVYISTKRAWILRSWDHFLIPKLFSRIHIRWGEPIHVAKLLNAMEFEALRKKIEERLLANHREDDLSLGWAHPL